MWDWVGGRYSLWSAVGFAVLLAIGEANHRALLDGAAAMDAHVLSEPLQCNLAAWHAMSVVWNRNGLGFDSHAVLPYDDRLRLLAVLPAAAGDGEPGQVGAPGRRAHRRRDRAGGMGRARAPAASTASSRRCTRAPTRCRPISSALRGRRIRMRPATTRCSRTCSRRAKRWRTASTAPDTQKAYPGNRPSTFFMLDELTPSSFGHLLAMYEHSVFIQATLWGINAFDQWGVELGKRIARDLQPAVSSRGEAGVTDPVSRALLSELNSRR
jgi:glucose-6-phosphate isomerase